MEFSTSSLPVPPQPHWISFPLPTSRLPATCTTEESQWPLSVHSSLTSLHHPAQWSARSPGTFLFAVQVPLLISECFIPGAQHWITFSSSVLSFSGISFRLVPLLTYPLHTGDPQICFLQPRTSHCAQDTDTCLRLNVSWIPQTLCPKPNS